MTQNKIRINLKQSETDLNESKQTKTNKNKLKWVQTNQSKPKQHKISFKLIQDNPKRHKMRWKLTQYNVKLAKTTQNEPEPVKMTQDVLQTDLNDPKKAKTSQYN